MKVGYKLYEEQSVYYGRPFTSAAYSFKKGTRVNISLTDTNSSNTYAYYRLKVITKNPENFEKEKQKISTKNDLPVKKKNWACHGQMNLL